MRTSTRRKLDGVLLAGTGVVAGLAGGIGAVGGDTERVRQLWAVATVQSDGSAQISEVVDYDFGPLPQGKHGMFRDVPGLPLDAPVVVESETAPEHLEVTTAPDGDTRLRIGDPNQTVSGEHRYRIEYPLPAVEVDGRVAWNAVGTEWEVDIERAEIHLFSPFEVVDLQCFVGGQGSNSPCDDVRQVDSGHVMATADDIDSGQGMSIEGRVGSPLSVMAAAVTVPPPPEDSGTGLLPPAAAPAGAALVAAAVTGRMVRLAGRERVAAGGPADAAWGGSGAGRSGAGTADAVSSPSDAVGSEPVGEIRVDHHELEQMATTEFAPPGDLTPPQGGIVLAETVQPEHKVAWLIDAAIDGAIDMVEEDHRVVRLVRTAPGAPDAAPILDVAFDGRDEIDLGSYDKDFGRAWNELGSQLAHWNNTSDLWDHQAESRRVLIRVFGAVAAVVGVVAAAGGGLLAASHGSGWLVLGALGGVLAGAGLATVIRGWELRVRTPAGSAAWLRTESFRRFLAESEAYHAEEAAKRGVLREYTAWAVALGEIDRWARAVSASTLAPATAGVAYAYLAPALLVSTASTATAPSSSSGGGGGGGVGGGAGGGGGGSW